MNEVVFSVGGAAVAARYSGDGGDSLAGALRGFRKVLGFGPCHLDFILAVTHTLAHQGVHFNCM